VHHTYEYYIDGLTSLQLPHADKVAQRIPVKSPQPYASDRRNLAYDPIRIHLNFDGIDSDMSAEKFAYIKKLATDSQDWLQAALKVVDMIL
jgi:hypothetical protein